MVVLAAPTRRRAQIISRKRVPLLQFVALGIVERVRRRAKRYNRFARIEIFANVFDLLLRQSPPAQVEHSQIGLAQGFEPGNILFGVLIGIRLQHGRPHAITFLSSAATIGMVSSELYS